MRTLLFVAAALAAAIAQAADPTGAVEFDVLAPNNPKGAVVRAADFGVSEASTNNTPALQAAIDHCKKTGAAKLVLERGRYRFTSDGKIDFTGLTDFEFDGGGADFVFFHQKGPNIQLQACHRIVVRNFSIDWDWEKDPLGSIVEIAEKDDKSVTFRFVDYEDFPRKDVRCAFMSPWDKATREVGYPDMDNGFSIDMSWGGPMPHPPRKWLAGNLLRVEKGISYYYVKKGALFRMNHYYYDMHNVVIANTTHLRMEDVEVKSNPGHAFIVDGTTHHCHFRNVNIRLPKDDLRRGVTCTADHFHVNRSQGFLKFENCEFSLGGDDCMNLHDCSLHAPIRLDDHTLRVKLRSRRPFGENDLVELRHGNFKPTGIACKVKTKVNEEGGYDITFPVKLPESEWEGFVLFDRTSCTHNVILRNCWFHGNRSRGLILQASDVTMENCRISHTEGPGMILSTGWTYKLWCEGSGVTNVVVRNCRFDRVNVAHRPRNGVVADIVMDSYARWPGHAPVNGYPVFQDILFENNVFTDPSGYLVSVREGSGVVLRDTKVVTTFADPFAPAYRGQLRAVPATSLAEVNTMHENRVPKADSSARKFSEADWKGTVEEEKATPSWMVQTAQLPVDTNEVAVSEPPRDMTLFLLVGQSNMAGRGPLSAEDRKAIPRCLKLNRDGKWVAATSPLHFDRRSAGYGIANTFVKRYLEEHPTETVGLVPCAVGGSLSVTWSPEPKADGRIGANYRYTLGRARTALKNGTFAGILWHQGEADVELLQKDPLHKRRYVARLAALAKALRTELGCQNVPFLVGEIGTLPCDCTAMNPVLREAAAAIPRGALVQARDLTGHLADGVHFDTPSYKVLGARYYDAWKAVSSRKTVLLIGDSIRMGYCEDVKTLMKDRADVYYPAENCMFSLYTLRKISDWVKIVPDPKAVDVIHFNNGLWDLGQRDGRECLTPVDVYASTEARVADELRHYFPNAKLVFATTTPVNESVSSPWHTKGNAEVERYNAAAVNALKGKVDAVDDLYSFVRDNGLGRFYQDIVHYSPEGSRRIAEQVVRVLDDVK